MEIERLITLTVAAFFVAFTLTQQQRKLSILIPSVFATAMLCAVLFRIFDGAFLIDQVRYSGPPSMKGPIFIFWSCVASGGAGHLVARFWKRKAAGHGNS